MIFIWIIKSSKETVWQVYMAGVLGSTCIAKPSWLKFLPLIPVKLDNLGLEATCFV